MRLPSSTAFAPCLTARGVFVLRGASGLSWRGAATALPARGVFRKSCPQSGAQAVIRASASPPHASTTRAQAVPGAAAQASPGRVDAGVANAAVSTGVTGVDTQVLTFQDAVARLQQYWKDRGCLVWHPYNTEVGAGTMNPATFLRVLGPEPWAVAYDEPSVRPDDSRYGENPNRLQCHTQFQVIVKPAPECTQELVVGSYRALGIDVTKRDVRFVEDNWESPALGAWGLGWEVWLDGMEITQFTYFQQAGSIGLDPVSVEITYGLERIIMALQGKTHFKDIVYAPGITYGEILMQNEVEMSRYNLDEADMSRNRTWFDEYEGEALQLLEKRLPVPAYNYLLKASHTFNVLDSRGAVGVTERARYFQRMRSLARNVAQLWIERREELEFPLLNSASRPQRNNRYGPTELPEPAPSLESQQEALGSLGATGTLIFELGVEELPAAEVSATADQVKKLLAALLVDARLQHDGVQVDATPRRIAASVTGLQTRQADLSKRVRGPPLRAAVGANGELTKAGSGFLKSQGISDVSKAEFDQDAGYMYAVVDETGRYSAHVLAELLPNALLAKISFSKTMRWNSSGVAFSRPIRWMLCLLDDVALPFAYAGIGSGTTTRTLRRQDGFARDVTVASAVEYASVIAQNKIVLSRDERIKTICDHATILASSIGGRVEEEHLRGALIEEVADLVEHPLPLLGRFDEDFLRLPDDVLVTVMKKHQRYLPVVDKDGKLMNAFITVANGDPDLADISAIRAGNEAVLRARYSDAAFFYDKDTVGKKLADFLPSLSGLTFQEKLGSMLDKVERVESAMPKLCDLMGLTAAETRIAVDTAHLYKSDLGSSMVVEMTSLAGIMGRHYALRSGEVSTDVADAIFDASLPRHSGDELPRSRAGAAVAIADRLDSLAGLFSVGLIPKSTADPFALRRAALGIVQTLISQDVSMSLQDAIAVVTSDKAVAESVFDFICKRLEAYLGDQGFRPDVVKAVLAIKENSADPCRAYANVRALQSALDSDAEKEILANACEVHGRAVRLVKSVSPSNDAVWNENNVLTTVLAVDESLFESDVENALLATLRDANSLLESDSSLKSRLRMSSDMKQAVDAFCDGVFVAAEDPAIRRNRVALLSRVARLTSLEADLSLLQL